MPWFHENSDDKDRRTFKNKNQSYHLEAVESAEETAMGLQKLGIGKDLARLTAYCGDRYYWVVTKTCVVRANL